MKQLYKDIGTACIMGLLVPTMVLGVMASLRERESGGTQEQMTQPPETQEHAKEEQIAVLMEDGAVAQMLMNDYLTGVVLAEMPASFEIEAHKAQAVVARTYTMRSAEHGGRHETATVCTDYSCCQAYVSEADYLAKGGDQASIDKIRSAVEETEGLVLTYEGELIEATYFSCSGGRTEDAVAVWGTDVPYLQATSSPGEEHAVHYTDTVTFTAEEFAMALTLENAGDPQDWFSDVRYTSGGGVDTMVIQDVIFKGTTLRRLLELRSTAFTVRTEGDQITITTRGYGHRVGMSQYGADAMAAGGSLYPEILAHYYEGTTLEQLSD